MKILCSILIALFVLMGLLNTLGSYPHDMQLMFFVAACNVGIMWMWARRPDALTRNPLAVMFCAIVLLSTISLAAMSDKYNIDLFTFEVIAPMVVKVVIGGALWFALATPWRKEARAAAFKREAAQ